MGRSEPGDFWRPPEPLTGRPDRSVSLRSRPPHSPTSSGASCAPRGPRARRPRSPCGCHGRGRRPARAAIVDRLARGRRQPVAIRMAIASRRSRGPRGGAGGPARRSGRWEVSKGAKTDRSGLARGADRAGNAPNRRARDRPFRKRIFGPWSTGGIAPIDRASGRHFESSGSPAIQVSRYIGVESGPEAARAPRPSIRGPSKVVAMRRKSLRRASPAHVTAMTVRPATRSGRFGSSAARAREWGSGPLATRCTRSASRAPRKDARGPSLGELRWGPSGSACFVTKQTKRLPARRSGVRRPRKTSRASAAETEQARAMRARNRCRADGCAATRSSASGSRAGAERERVVDALPMSVSSRTLRPDQAPCFARRRRHDEHSGRSPPSVSATSTRRRAPIGTDLVSIFIPRDQDCHGPFRRPAP